MAAASDADRRFFRPVVRRIAITAVAVALWFWTQSLIATRNLPGTVIIDQGHNITAPLNECLSHHPQVTNAVLMVSSGLIDLLGLFLLGAWVFGGTARPFLSLLMVIALRQIMQALCALPSPEGMIWHSPGFPSLLVTYNVGNDFFFSGHTAIAVVGVYELAKLRRRWLTVAAVVVLTFEILTVLTLRVHYTMDVFTGLITALWVCGVSSGLTSGLDQRLAASAKAS